MATVWGWVLLVRVLRRLLGLYSIRGRGKLFQKVRDTINIRLKLNLKGAKEKLSLFLFITCCLHPSQSDTFIAEPSSHDQ